MYYSFEKNECITFRNIQVLYHQSTLQSEENKFYNRSLTTTLFSIYGEMKFPEIGSQGGVFRLNKKSFFSVKKCK